MDEGRGGNVIGSELPIPRKRVRDVSEVPQHPILLGLVVSQSEMVK